MGVLSVLDRKEKNYKIEFCGQELSVKDFYHSCQMRGRMSFSQLSEGCTETLSYVTDDDRFDLAEVNSFIAQLDFPD